MKVAIILLFLLLVTACTTPKPVYSNPGYDEIDAYVNNTSIDVVPLENITNTTINATTQEAASVEQPSGWWGKTKKLAGTIWHFLDKMAKDLFGDGAWYFIVAAIVILLFVRTFQTIGLILLFFVLLWIFTRVL